MRDQVTRFIGAVSSRAAGFQPESLSGRLQLMARAARLLTNLLRWRRYTKERHGLGLLGGEILSDILLPVASDGWEVGAGDALRKARIFFLLSLQRLCLCLAILLQIVATVPSDIVPFAVSLRLNGK